MFLKGRNTEFKSQEKIIPMYSGLGDFDVTSNHAAWYCYVKQFILAPLLIGLNETNDAIGLFLKSNFHALLASL